MAKKESFFWTSYSDLMTSLFFVMLVLFVLVIVILHNKISEQALKLEEYEKIEEIKQSLNNIDSTYFIYSPEHKKHILNVEVQFPKGKSEMCYIDELIREDLKNAGRAIKKQIDNASSINSDIQYLLVIEGQASKDNFEYNYELSYQRALALRNFLSDSGIDFGEKCEVLIAGSGTAGTMRETDEERNQRFMIHIIPKTGTINTQN